ARASRRRALVRCQHSSRSTADGRRQTADGRRQTVDGRRSTVDRTHSHLMPDIRERLNRDIDPAEYQAIRRLWINHSPSEDAHDLPGLIATLTEDCVYEIVPTGQHWSGHDGARSFYLEFLGAFPDVKFDLQDIVIGPQGVIEVTRMTGTHLGEWSNLPPTGQ